MYKYKDNVIVSNQNGEWRDSFTIELWKREGNLGMHRKGFGFACEGWNMLSATGFFFWLCFCEYHLGGFDLVGRAKILNDCSKFA